MKNSYAYDPEGSMEKALLIIGVTSISAGILSLLYAALNRYGLYHVLDGSPDLYISLERRMKISLLSGIVLAVIGTMCVIVRSVIG